MRSLSTVISALAVAVCACAIATQASAATVSPSVTVQLTDAGVADGWRTVRVEVTGNCGPDAPDGTTMDVRPSIVARWKDTSKAPYTPDEKMVEIVDAPNPPDPDDDEGYRPGPTATFTFRVTGGIHAVGKGEVVCTAPVPLGEFGEPTDDPHPKKAVGYSDNFLVAPPHLVDIYTDGASYSSKPGKRPACTPNTGYVHTWVKWASQHPAFQLWLDPRGLAGFKYVSRPVLPKIHLHMKGAGLRDPKDWRPSVLGFQHSHLLGYGYVVPPRTGTLRLWVEVDGLPSNSWTIHVKSCRGIIKTSQ